MNKINIVSSQAVLEVSSFNTDKRSMSSSPLVNSLINKKPSWCWDSQPSVCIFGIFLNFRQQHSNMVR